MVRGRVLEAGTSDASAAADKGAVRLSLRRSAGGAIASRDDVQASAAAAATAAAAGTKEAATPPAPAVGDQVRPMGPLHCARRALSVTSAHHLLQAEGRPL